MASKHAAAVLQALGARGKSLGASSAAMPDLREDAIQMSIARHLDLLAMPGVVWWHCPNGGLRGRAEAGRFKLMGVKPGVPDILALHGGRLYGLELKAAGGRVSEQQSKMLHALGMAGASVAVAVGIDEALAQLGAWGLIRVSGTGRVGQ